VLAHYGLPAWEYLTLPAHDAERVLLVAVAQRASELERKASK
jgi:hypothetical protein